MKILYVEDDPRDADLTQRFFKSNASHLQVDWVESQPEAEILLAEKDYDLVLTDLKLPQGDGLGLLAHIRDNDIPAAVVVITGRGDEDTVVAALKAGADDYIIKQDDYLLHLPSVLHDARHRFQVQSNRKGRPIHLLYAEHNPADVDLTHRHINYYTPHILMEVVALGSTVLQKLTAPNNQYDILLLDYRLPGMHALEVLKELRQVHHIEIPVVFTTGHGDEEVALQALKLGAFDYIVKTDGYLHRLPAILENAIYQYRLKAEENRYHSLFETVPVGLYRTTMDGQCVEANPALIGMLGYPDLTAIQAVNVSDHYIDLQERQRLLDQLAEKDTVLGFIVALKRQDGSHLWVEMDARPERNIDGEIIFLQGAMKDITDRVKAEKDLQQLNEELEDRIEERTERLNILVNAMTGREVRMAELKRVIRKLREQLKKAGMKPVANDPLIMDED